MFSKETQKLIEDMLNYFGLDKVDDLFIVQSDRISGNIEEFRYKLTEEFIDFFSDKLRWEVLSRYQKLSEKLIKKYKDKVNWKYISQYQTLSPEFIDKFADKLDWEEISRNQQLPETLIDKYAEKVNWTYICEKQKLSEDFIEKYKDKVDWKKVSIYQKLSESFIEKYADRVDWEAISAYQKLSTDFIEKYMDKFSLYLNYISEYQKLSENFIEKYFYFFDNLGKIHIMKYQELSDKFIDKHAKELDFWRLSAYQNLSKETILKYKDKIEFINILLNDKISYEVKSDPEILKYILKSMRNYIKQDSVNINTMDIYVKYLEKTIKEQITSLNDVFRYIDSGILNPPERVYEVLIQKAVSNIDKIIKNPEQWKDFLKERMNFHKKKEKNPEQVKHLVLLDFVTLAEKLKNDKKYEKDIESMMKKLKNDFTINFN